MRTEVERAAASLWAVVIALLATGCGGTRIASEVPAEGQCVPVVCPVGEVEEKGRVVAARTDADGVELLVGADDDAWLVRPGGQRDRIELPNEDPHPNDAYTVDLGNRWSVDDARAVNDGFVLSLSGPFEPPRACVSSTPNSTLFGLWRIEHGDIAWRVTINASESLKFRPTALLAVSEDEVAYAYLVDEGLYERAFMVERRSLTTGALLATHRFENAESWSTAALGYSRGGLSFALRPEEHPFWNSFYVHETGGSTVRVPRSRRYREMVFSSSGAVAVHRGRTLRLAGDPVLRLGGRDPWMADAVAIETEVGRAVAVEVSGSRGDERRGYSVIVGDSGVALAFEHDAHVDGWNHRRREIVPVDAERLLLVEGTEHRRLSVLTCAGSQAAVGLTCETSDRLRLGDGRAVIAR